MPSKKRSALQFTDAEKDGARLKEHDRSMEQAAAKGKAPPKDQKKLKRRMIDQKSGKGGKKSGKADTGQKTVNTAGHLQFEEERPKPPSKLSHAVKTAPGLAVSTHLHRKISEVEDDNVGVESVHRLEQTAEAGGQFAQHSSRAHKLKERRTAERAEVNALYQRHIRENPQLASNPLSRWQQKQAIKKQYAAARRSGQTAGGAAKGTATSVEKVSNAMNGAAEGAKKVGSFFYAHKKGLAIILALFLIVVMLLNIMSSCSVLASVLLGGGSGTSFPSQDADMLGAEADYAALEAALQNELDNYASLHPGYDEYHFELDAIGHDPYVLIAILSAYHQGAWTQDQVQGTLQMLFDRQYTLTETVTTETRYNDGVPYTYYICTVTLDNFDLSHLPVYIMGEEQLSQYANYIATQGNRPDLFPTSEYPNAVQRQDYLDYDVPPEALEDETFAAMLTEAEKYLGYPYVWGGSNPSTSFDCSGFVSWVINHSGWDVGRLGAQGLFNICTPVSPANARPGDLVFFRYTYDAPDPDGVTHCGIYVGGNMMVHCGDPISYADLNASYWQNHFYCYGRLP